jgi:hypothetical protein
MGLNTKWKLFGPRCARCNAKIPETDIQNALSYDTWVGQLYCKKCRGEGAYEDRCSICNNSRIREIEDREYNPDEFGKMHKKCLEYLLNDWKYKLGSHYDATMKNFNSSIQ